MLDVADAPVRRVTAPSVPPVVVSVHLAVVPLVAVGRGPVCALGPAPAGQGVVPLSLQRPSRRGALELASLDDKRALRVVGEALAGRLALAEAALQALTGAVEQLVDEEEGAVAALYVCKEKIIG